MPRKVLNLELSSGGFSAPAPGVEARDAAFDGVAEFVVEPGRAVSAARSAMVVSVSVSRPVSAVEIFDFRRISEQAVMSCVAVRGPAGDFAREALTSTMPISRWWAGGVDLETQEAACTTQHRGGRQGLYGSRVAFI